VLLVLLKVQGHPHREALVNLIVHQDYNDKRTVAQIELEPHRTTMVNAGASLVSETELINGGTSTARNPLLALSN